MTQDPAPVFEIDHGDSSPEPVRPALAAGQASADEREADRLLAAARVEALAQWEAGSLARQRVDIEGLVLAGLCGEGIGAIFRVEHWRAGESLAMIISLASLGVAGWMWQRTRHPAAILGMLPRPFDPSTVSRTVPMDASQRAASRLRQEAELEVIRTHTTELATCRRQLRSAILAAAGGAFCGWLAGLAGNPGVPMLAGSAAAGVAAVAGWQAATGALATPRAERIFFGVVPAVALVAALISGASPWSAIAGPLAAAAAGWYWRRLLLALIAPVEPVA